MEDGVGYRPAIAMKTSARSTCWRVKTDDLRAMERTINNGRTTQCTRRTALTTIGAGVALSLSGCTGDVLGGKSELERQLETAREATSKYQDPKQALNDGFVAGGPYVPGMGWHWQHPKRGQEAAQNGFDIEEPNLLTYLDADEGLQLGAIEWGAPVEAVSENPDLFADTDGSETWHVHDAATHVFALPDGEPTKPPTVPFDAWITNDNWAEFRPPDPELEPGDTVALNWGSLEAKTGDRTARVVDVAATHPDLNTLHAWVHTENPDGVFAPVNTEYGGQHH